MQWVASEKPIMVTGVRLKVSHDDFEEWEKGKEPAAIGIVATRSGQDEVVMRVPPERIAAEGHWYDVGDGMMCYEGAVAGEGEPLEDDYPVKAGPYRFRNEADLLAWRNEVARLRDESMKDFE